jgi:hypothetical protein
MCAIKTNAGTTEFSSLQRLRRTRVFVLLEATLRASWMPASRRTPRATFTRGTIRTGSMTLLQPASSLTSAAATFILAALVPLLIVASIAGELAWHAMVGRASARHQRRTAASQWCRAATTMPARSRTQIARCSAGAATMTAKRSHHKATLYSPTPPNLRTPRPSLSSSRASLQPPTSPLAHPTPLPYTHSDPPSRHIQASERRCAAHVRPADAE